MKIGGVYKGDPIEVAIKERVRVVATRRAHTVGAAGGRVIGTSCKVANRRDIKPVELACWQGRQKNVQPGDFDLEFRDLSAAAASGGNDRRCCGAAGDQGAPGGEQGRAPSNFPSRARNGGPHQIVREDFGHIPPIAGDVEIVIYTSELPGADGGVPLIRDTVHAIKVAIVPKCGRSSGRRRCACRSGGWCMRGRWRGGRTTSQGGRDFIRGLALQPKGIVCGHHKKIGVAVGQI